MMQITFEHFCSARLNNFCLDFTMGSCSVVYDPTELLSTVMLSALVGLEEMHSGKLLLDGISYDDYFADRQLLSCFGYVFDEGIMLANLTFRENLLLPWRKRFEGESEKHFDQELKAWMTHLELKIDPNLRPAFASPTQRKFMGFIRAVLLKPEYLLIDDPYYLLNKTERHRLFGFLTELRQTQKMLIGSADDDFTGSIASEVIDLSSFCPA